jgi:hypothetical protein
MGEAPRYTIVLRKKSVKDDSDVVLIRPQLPRERAMSGNILSIPGMNVCENFVKIRTANP